jgi:amidohydrolase
MAKDLSFQETLEEYFRWFHSHPELSLQERETSARIVEILSDSGVKTLDLGLDTGVLACVRGGTDAGNETVVALRADIDALPVSEESGLPYASRNEGRMHACGHDFHLTVLLGAAMLLHGMRGSLAGTVKLIFQPAEEESSGAEKVIATGMLDDIREIYGLHVAAGVDVGVVGVCAGAEHAAVDRFTVRARGKGGHAAQPHKCADPIVAMAQFINAAQVIAARNVDPFESAVVSVTQIHSGNTWNVIPDEVFAEGTVRTYSDATRARVLERLADIGEGVGLSAGVDMKLDVKNLGPATNNDPELAAFVADTARELGMTVSQGVPDMSGEDFALYQQRVKGVFFNIGVGGVHPLHSPHFTVDPAPLASASWLMATLAERALRRLSA